MTVSIYCDSIKFIEGQSQESIDFELKNIRSNAILGVGYFLEANSYVLKHALNKVIMRWNQFPSRIVQTESSTNSFAPEFRPALSQAHICAAIAMFAWCSSTWTTIDVQGQQDATESRLTSLFGSFYSIQFVYNPIERHHDNVLAFRFMRRCLKQRVGERYTVSSSSLVLVNKLNRCKKQVENIEKTINALITQNISWTFIITDSWILCFQIL